MVYSFLRRGTGEGGADLISLDPVMGHVGTAQSCNQGRFRVDIRKHFCMGRAVKEQNRFPGEMVNGPSLSLTKIHLDTALNKHALTTGQAVGQDAPCRSFPTENILF